MCRWILQLNLRSTSWLRNSIHYLIAQTSEGNCCLRDATWCHFVPLMICEKWSCLNEPNDSKLVSLIVVWIGNRWKHASPSENFFTKALQTGSRWKPDAVLPRLRCGKHIDFQRFARWVEEQRSLLFKICKRNQPISPLADSRLPDKRAGTAMLKRWNARWFSVCDEVARKILHVGWPFVRKMNDGTIVHHCCCWYLLIALTERRLVPREAVQ